MLDVYCTEPAQHLITAGEVQDVLDRDLSDVIELALIIARIGSNLDVNMFTRGTR